MKDVIKILICSVSLGVSLCSCNDNLYSDLNSSVKEEGAINKNTLSLANQNIDNFYNLLAKPELTYKKYSTLKTESFRAINKTVLDKELEYIIVNYSIVKDFDLLEIKLNEYYDSSVFKSHSQLEQKKLKLVLNKYQENRIAICSAYLNFNKDEFRSPGDRLMWATIYKNSSEKERKRLVKTQVNVIVGTISAIAGDASGVIIAVVNIVEDWF